MTSSDMTSPQFDEAFNNYRTLMDFHHMDTECRGAFADRLTELTGK